MTVLLGTTTAGGAGDLFGANDITVTRRQASASGNIDTMRGTFTTSAGCNVTFVLYADSASAPAGLLGKTSPVSVVAGTGTTAGTMLTPVAVTSGTFYWIGVWVQGATLNLNDNPAGGYTYRSGQVAIPDPFGTPTGSDATLSTPVTGEDTGLAGGGNVFTLPAFNAIPFME